MIKLPYIEPTIRTIAGGLVTAFAIALVWTPDNLWLWFFLLLFVSLNLFQSGFTHFCLMEKLLQRLGLRSELTEIKRLGEQNKLYRDTLDLLNETVIELDSSSKLLYCSNNWGSLIENLDSEFEVTAPPSLMNFLHPEDRPTLARLLANLLTEQIESLRFRMGQQQENQRWIEGKFIRLLNPDGTPLIRGVLRDISEYYLQEKRISHMAMHDALTGLPNRILLDDRMDNALTQSKRAGTKLAVIFIDLDNFKQVNDTHGHKVGDQLLIAVSSLLKSNLRESDTLARWGGDEFVVLLPNLKNSEEAVSITQGLMHVAKQAVHIEGLENLVTLSIGISIFPDNAEDPHNLLIQADQALFYAKSQGRNNYQLYDTIRQHETSITNVDLNIKLAVAIRNGEITHEYQPIVSAKTGEIIGMEVHMCWHDPQRGPIHPSIFLPMAENLGLMHELDNKLIKLSLLDLKKFHLLHPEFTLSFNISNHLLLEDDFASMIAAQLSKLDISPSKIHIAISESAMSLNSDRVKTNLRKLADYGVGITLDHFGTDLGSHSNLHDFPFNELKIDVSFIRRIKLTDIRLTVKAIVEMAHVLKYLVSAEGVDDKLTADILVDLGVEKLQGNYYFPPAPIEEYLSSSENTQLDLS